MTTSVTTANGTSAATTNTAGAGSSSSGSALSSLSGNLTDFLSLLMTQLQNQDPSSPMDPNQFTSQLVQYASVEQQINTNSSLTQLIQLTQGNQMLQSSAMVGKQVAVTSDHLAVQNGQAALSPQPAADGNVTVTVSDPTGKVLKQDTVAAAAAGTSWTWNGKDLNGSQVTDGSYSVAVTDPSTGSAVPFSVLGTATGVQRSGTSTQLQVGSLAVDFSAVQQVSGS